eukprot:snap_masked-scaffold_9-processed-gene-2.41-mRNA-1 protein AED:1.00 eAED:1.00 QI:0/0/0/0/1/1/4/0/141
MESQYTLWSGLFAFLVLVLPILFLVNFALAQTSQETGKLTSFSGLYLLDVQKRCAKDIFWYFLQKVPAFVPENGLFQLEVCKGLMLSLASKLYLIFNNLPTDIIATSTSVSIMSTFCRIMSPTRLTTVSAVSPLIISFKSF